MKRAMLALVALLVLGLGIWALVSCESADNAAARRANAEAAAVRAQAEVERARGEADAERARAQADADAERAVQERESSRLMHQQFLEIVPLLAVGLGGLVVLAVVALIGLDVYRRNQRWEATRLPPRQLPGLPPVTNVWIIPPPAEVGKRAEYWRQIEARARGEGAE